MQVIRQADPDGGALVARWPRRGAAAVRLGSQLVVEEGQQAVFLRDGEALDTFGPGRHTLTTANLPLLTRHLGLAEESDDPFQAAVALVATRTYEDFKWGTREPMVYRDPELGVVPLRAFGEFATRVADARQFTREVVEARETCTADGLEAHLKEVIVARLTELLGEGAGSIFELPLIHDDLVAALQRRVGDTFGGYGLELVGLSLGAISPSRDVQKRIDRRRGGDAAGN